MNADKPRVPFQEISADKPLIPNPDHFSSPENMNLHTLLRRMRILKTQMAVIESSRGDTLGIVTIHDILDALVDDVGAPVSRPKELESDVR